MSEENFAITFYQSRLKELAIEVKKYSQRSKMWVFIRLICFIGIILLAYFLFPYTFISTAALIVSVVLFLFFVRKSAENREKLNYVKQLVLINENEIKASNHDFSAFKNGKEYIDPNHSFSYDMDLFGNRSFFQFLNRTVTKKGEEALVYRLLNGISSPKESAEAIDELTEKKEWYQGYLAHGSTLEKDETEKSISRTIGGNVEVKRWVNILRFVLPVLTILLSAAYYFDIINGVQFLIVAALLMLPVRQTLKKTNTLHKKLSSIGKRVAAMSNQLAIFEKEKFNSELLSNYQEILFSSTKNGKQGLLELSKIVKHAEYRDNILVAVFLNFYLAWDFHLLTKVEKWKAKYAPKTERWEEVVYELEALISGANFRFNYKAHTTIPTLTDPEKGRLKLVNVGHPIIPTKKLVKNNFEFPEGKQFAIITGPNMAGKSTFLRSVGVNLMMAHAGLHVFAEEFVFPKMKLYSSMRTSDDLKDETSYFHAELLRLRFIVDAIEKGEKVFIILDEILKGTNSKDKEEGSSKFLQKLIQLKVKGIIATHDLSLTNLADTHPTIINKYFDTEIDGEEIYFDYCIRDGVAKNMNASFLLKKMRLIDS